METKHPGEKTALLVSTFKIVSTIVDWVFIVLICVVAFITICFMAVVIGIPICILFVALSPMLSKEERRRQALALASAITDM